jgi:hypothetical protein
VANQADAAGVPARDLLHDLAGGVAGAIIDHDDFGSKPAGKRRCEDAFEKYTGELLLVVDGHEYRKQTLQKP